MTIESHLQAAAGEARASSTAATGRAVGSSVREGLFATALEVLDVLGASAFSLRTIASFAHYSASAVSYHAKPFNEFCDELWRRIAHDLIGADAPEVPFGDAEPERIRTWTIAFPGRADWFLAYLPDHPFDPTSDSDLRKSTSVGRFHARRLQAALELVMRHHDRDMTAREMSDAIQQFRSRGGSR